MAEFFGAIQRGLGFLLSGIYDVVPSYGVAIILLTVIIRVLLIPLTIKQIRAMTAQTKLAPEVKKLQQKHKGDRQKMNEELMKLYQEHGVNPFGGCLPLLMQAPVFIALYSVLRASIAILPAVSTLPAGGTIPKTAFEEKDFRSTICRPSAQQQGESLPIRCTTEKGAVSDFRVAQFTDARSRKPRAAELISFCRPRLAESRSSIEFSCFSALGTGHLPVDGDLFEDVTRERATFLGMHPACSATQVQSRAAIRQCTSAEEDAGGVNLVPYYLLIALFIGSTYYQSKQMAQSAQGQMAQQQKMMTRIMPVFLGFISLSIPSGVNVYWLTSNLWTIGQQHLVLRSRAREAGANGAPPPKEAPVKDNPGKPDPGTTGPSRHRKRRKGKGRR